MIKLIFELLAGVALFLVLLYAVVGLVLLSCLRDFAGFLDKVIPDEWRKR